MIAGLLDDPIRFESYRLKFANDRRSGLQAPGNHQGCFCKPVAGIKGFPTKAARFEGGRKVIQVLCGNRLSAVERETPTAKVQVRALLFSDLANAQVVSEIWPTARVRLVTSNGLKPAQRPHKKGFRRHENAPGAYI